MAKVQGLISAGSSVDVKDRLGLAPLHYAARHGKSEIVAVLLKAGATVDSAVVAQAIKASNPKLVRSLLTKLPTHGWGRLRPIHRLAITSGGKPDLQVDMACVNFMLQSYLEGGSEESEICKAVVAGDVAKARSVIQGASDQRPAADFAPLLTHASYAFA